MFGQPEETNFQLKERDKNWSRNDKTKSDPLRDGESDQRSTEVTDRNLNGAGRNRQKGDDLDKVTDYFCATRARALTSVYTAHASMTQNSAGRICENSSALKLSCNCNCVCLSVSPEGSLRRSPCSVFSGRVSYSWMKIRLLGRQISREFGIFERFSTFFRKLSIAVFAKSMTRWPWAVLRFIEALVSSTKQRTGMIWCFRQIWKGQNFFQKLRQQRFGHAARGWNCFGQFLKSGKNWNDRHKTTPEKNEMLSISSLARL